MLNLQPWNRPNLHFSLAYACWRARWYVLALTITGALAGAAYGHFRPKTYTASALVLVVPQKVPERYVNSAVSTDLQDRLASISQQILSNTRLQKIIDDFQLYRREAASLYPEELLALMRKRIQIKLEKGWSHDRPGAFHVEFEGADPGIVAEVANRIVSLFLEENLRERELSAEGTSDFLEAQVQEARRRLEDLESKVTAYKLRHVGALPGQESYLMNAISRLQQELQFNDEAVARDNLTKTSIESAMQSAKSSAAITAQLAAKAQHAQSTEEKSLRLSDKIAAELQRARLRFTPKHPTIIELELELANAKANEKADSPTRKPAPPSDSPQYVQWQLQNREREDNFKTQLTLIDQDLATRARRRAEIIEKASKLEQQLAQLPVSELEMGALTRDFELSLSNYKSLLEKRQNAQMAAEMEHRQKGESFKVIDPARVPQKALGFPLEAAAAAGAALGLALALLFCTLRLFHQNKLLGEWDIPEGVQLLGHIPALPAPAIFRPKA